MNIFENETLVERVEGWIEKLLRVVEYSLIEVRSIENFVVFLVIIQDRVWFFESCGKYFRPNFSTISWKFWKTISRNPIWIHEIFEFSNFPVIRESYFAQIIARDISENGNTIRIFIIKKKNLDKNTLSALFLNPIRSIIYIVLPRNKVNNNGILMSYIYIYIHTILIKSLMTLRSSIEITVIEFDINFSFIKTWTILNFV